MKLPLSLLLSLLLLPAVPLSLLAQDKAAAPREKASAQDENGAALAVQPENVVAKGSDTVLTTEGNNKTILSCAFYVFKAAPYRGKKVIFRMNVKRTEGESPLGCRFRCSTDKGIQATKTFPVEYGKNGETVPVELLLDVPNLSNIKHFNVSVAFRRRGQEKCTWEITDARFVDPEPGAVAKKQEEVLPEVLLSAGLTADKEEKPLVLVKEGKVCFVIVTADQPDAIAKYAAKELQDHFKLACGTAPTVIGESQYTSGPAIMVGNTAAAKKYGIEPAMLAPETLVAARLGDMIVLSGGDNPDIPANMVPGRAFVPVGTLYAAYEFLEKTVGFRWYWPGKHGTYVPKVKNLKVKKLYTVSRPQYDTRKTFFSLVANDPDVSKKDCEAWYRRNRFGGSLGDPVANHAFNGWIERFAKTHPEYLALQADGTRKVNFKPGGGHVCMSNPDVLRQTVEDKLAELEEKKFTSFAKVMPGDSNGLFYCKCPECQAKVRPEMGKNGLHSDAVWGFVNKVAAEVAVKAPGKKIVCCAYTDYKRRPSFPLLPNVAVTLCFGPVPRASAEYKRAWKEFLDEWSATGAKLYVWEYWNSSRYYRGIFGAPAVFPRQLKEIYAMDAGRISGRAIELCNKDGDGKGVRGWCDWVYDVQNLYAAGKLMWDPSEDISADMEEYYTKFFGPAAEPIRKFHQELEQAWADHGYVAGQWDYQRVWQETYPPEFVDRMMGLLKKAVKLAAGQEPYAYRTKKLFDGYQSFERNSKLFRGLEKKTNPKNITVPKVSGAPSDADWTKAAVLKNFVDSYNVYQQKSQTVIRLLHDGKNLYFKAECHIPEGVASVQWVPEDAGKRDALLWNYESVELFLARGQESAQFIVAPDNCLLDAFNAPGNLKGSSFKWNCEDIKWSTARRDNRCWEGFLTIPLDAIKFTETGKDGEYRFNAYRDCRYIQTDGTNQWEQSCYLPTFGSFQNIDRFGILTLGE